MSSIYGVEFLRWNKTHFRLFEILMKEKKKDLSQHFSYFIHVTMEKNN